EGIMITDLSGKIISVNDAFSKITGYTGEEIISQRPSILKSGKQDKNFYEKMWDDIKEKGVWKGEIWNRKKDGTIYPEWLAISPIYDEINKPIQYVAVFSDFSEMKKNQIQLEELAHYDVLTNLPNRFSLHQHLDFIIKSSKRQKTKFTVMFIDLDRFKNINDAYGHNIGDEVLRQTSKRLKSVLRESDIVSRIGGDEFVVALYDTRNLDDIKKIAKTILKKLEKPFHINNVDHFISGSIGISIYPDDAISADTLLKHADIAMYKSKSSGKNTYQFFSKEMADNARNISSLHNDLNKALTNNEFYLVYQPQFNIVNNEIIGVEALIRWKHSELGEVSPDNFIGHAEESQLIIPIGKWVLNQAIGDLALIKKVYNGTFTIAVNVSHIQLNQEFVNYLEFLINNDSTICDTIKIEITETSAMKSPLTTQNVLKQIKDLGFKISLDDFGTGYSALNVIKQLSIDEIKIDQSFIKDVPGDKDDEELVSTIIAMAKVMKKSLIAEGVEELSTKDFLVDRRCDTIQGYLISKPLNLEDLLNYLSAKY
ncbi:EAL domain-containing protein, partial [Arcobacteraceae bacterium]|nr:EAL domain-containing protein [Arcobacteraceae bacterium]